jgi:hypothetical protein
VSIVALRRLMLMRYRRGHANDRSPAQTKLVPLIFETVGFPVISRNSAIQICTRPTVHIFIHSRLHSSFSATSPIQKLSPTIPHNIQRDMS